MPSALYGGLQGSGRQVTRTGTKASGMRAYVQNDTVRVAVRLAEDGTCEVLAQPRNRGTSKVLFSGNAEDALTDDTKE